MSDINVPYRGLGIADDTVQYTGQLVADLLTDAQEILAPLLNV